MQHSPSITAKILGISASTLKSWTKHFDGVKAEKNEDGKIHYTDNDVKELKKVHYLIKERGFTIKGAKKELERKGSEAVNKAKLIDKMEEVRDFLSDLKARL